MQDLLAAVRRACSPATWSLGVKLSREGAVVGERETADEVELRVATDSGIVSPAVVLYPQDTDWSCECNSREDACAHVAAAVIALRQARQAGKRLPGAEQGAPGHIGYRFSRTPEGLALERCVVQGSDATPLTTTLSALASGKVQGPGFAATQTDVSIERTLGTRIRGLLPRAVMPDLLGHLVDHADVQLDGKPTKVGGPTTGLVARVLERPEGFLLCLEQETSIREVFANGVVRCADGTLRAVQDSGLCTGDLESLRRGRLFRSEGVHELVADVLPALRHRMTVRVDTDKLPRLQRGTMPRLVLELTREGQSLSVLPTLVYGDPPGSRIDGDKLVHLSGPVPARDREEEQRLARRLERQLDMRPGHRLQVAGQDAVSFAARLRAFCAASRAPGDGAPAEVQLRGTGLDDFFLAPPLTPRLAVQDDDFQLTFTSDLSQRDDSLAGEPGSEGDPGGRGSTRHADVSAVMRAWRDGESVVALAEGGFAPLPSDWLSRCGATVADLLAAKAASAGVLPPSALGDLSRLCVALEQPPPPGLQRLRAVLDGGREAAEPVLPVDLRATLRSYQREGVAWLQMLRDAGLGAVLADDMGLGKTIQALCAVSGSTLVVAPTSVLHNWAKEIERFRPALRYTVYHGPGRDLEGLAREDALPLVVLTTYAILRLDIDALAGTSWDTVILDESQNIKNPDSQVARAAYRLRAATRITLSGTPVENRLEELWSQMHFTNPGLLGGRSDFQDRYAKPIVSGVLDAAERLRARIRPFVLRRMKRQVAAELPPRTEVVLRCELSESERAVYDAIVAATREEVVARLQAGGDVLAALEALLRLRQACCHWALVPGQRHRAQPSSREGGALPSAKVGLLLETLDKVIAAGHKALIFSQWTSLLDLVEPHLQQADIGFARLDGSTRDREAVVASFQDEAAGPPVMLISLKAGGTGLSLTAADNVFLLDPWWNPAVEDQAADRAHRIGQQRPVIVHRLVAADTVEERILALQEQKRDLADLALSAGGRGVSITREDLLALLR